MPFPCSVVEENVPPLFDANVTVAPVTGPPLAVTSAVIDVVYPLSTFVWLADTDIMRGE